LSRRKGGKKFGLPGLFVMIIAAVITGGVCRNYLSRYNNPPLAVKLFVRRAPNLILIIL
jgi:hypothetical protein